MSPLPRTPPGWFFTGLVAMVACTSRRPEPRLAETFGDEWADYRGAVRGWL